MRYVLALAFVCSPIISFAQSFSLCTVDESWNVFDSPGDAHDRGSTYASKQVSTENSVFPLLYKFGDNSGIARVSGGTLGAFAYAELYDPNQKVSIGSQVVTQSSANMSAGDANLTGQSSGGTIQALANLELDGLLNPNGGKLFVNIYHGGLASPDQLVLDVATGQAYYDSNSYLGTHGVQNIHAVNAGNGKEKVTFQDMMYLDSGMTNRISIGLKAIADAQIIDVNPPKDTLQKVDFLNTLSFSTSGPAFDLPDGVSINSPSWNIVNNRFQGPVPEPATLTLLCTLGYSAAKLRRRT